MTVQEQIKKLMWPWLNPKVELSIEDLRFPHERFSDKLKRELKEYEAAANRLRLNIATLRDELDSIERSITSMRIGLASLGETDETTS